MVLYFKQVVDSLLQLGYLLAKDAGANVLQDLMANEQAVKFFCAKP
jgi:hypothetical protein